MTLISLAITVAFVYSALVPLGIIAGMTLWWELATLVVIMLLGDWIAKCARSLKRKGH